MATCIVPANDVLFEDFCTLLKQLADKKKQKKEQDKILIKFINDFRLKVGQINGKKNSSFFPILRLLLPDRERERGAYNLKETKLGELLVKVLSLNKESNEAKNLLKYRSVNNSTQNSDFGGVAFYVLKNLVPKNPGNLTIGNINDTLDKIAGAEVGNKWPKLEEAFIYILRNCSSEQLKWFLRIILKDLRISMGMNRILAAFHPDAPDLFDGCSNLSKVCEELEDGDTRPSEMGVKIFYAMSPMLSERLDITKVTSTLLPNKEYQIESKFDGERFQVHMENGIFEYYSRKGFTYSEHYGKTYDSGLLTPSLKDCFGPTVKSFILDGEMMGWDKYRQCFGSKGMAFDIKKTTANSKYQPCFCAFDVLYYNGRSLAGGADRGGLPLAARLRLLHTLFTDVPGVFMHSTGTIVKDTSDILEALNKAISEEEEGIVVKATDSYYVANKRNAGWYKIKPEYTESTMSDLDLVIVGADEAANKRHGRARSFHVACRDTDSSGERWVSVGRVSSGVSHAELERVCGALQRHWVAASHAPPPPCLVFNKRTPDYWILPEHSTVLQVRASELVRSAEFGATHTLRFPRVTRVRDDKPHQHVLMLTEFNDLVADRGAVVKLSTKTVDEDQIGDAPPSKRKRAGKPPPRVPDHLRMVPAPESDPVLVESAPAAVLPESAAVPVQSRALAGRELAVLSDDDDCKRPQLVAIIVSHGGKVVQNPGPNTWSCIVGKLTFAANNRIKSREYDIHTTRWLRSLKPSQEPCGYSPLDMLAMRTATRKELRRHYDAFGDSYTEDVDEDTLKKCLDKIQKEEPKVYLTSQEMLQLDRELFGGSTSPYSFLRSYNIHFYDDDGFRSICATIYGASVHSIEYRDLTQVVVPATASVEDICSVKSIVKCPVISAKWIDDCLSKEMLVDTDDYVL